MCEKVITEDSLKGTFGQKKVELKRAITDLNVPNGSRDIPFQSQEFGEDGHRHFVGFQPHFHLNMTSQTQCCNTMKNESTISQESFI